MNYKKISFELVKNKFKDNEKITKALNTLEEEIKREQFIIYAFDINDIHFGVKNRYNAYVLAITNWEIKEPRDFQTTLGNIMFFTTDYKFNGQEILSSINGLIENVRNKDKNWKLEISSPKNENILTKEDVEFYFNKQLENVSPNKDAIIKEEYKHSKKKSNTFSKCPKCENQTLETFYCHDTNKEYEKCFLENCSFIREIKTIDRKINKSDLELRTQKWSLDAIKLILSSNHFFEYYIANLFITIQWLIKKSSSISENFFEELLYFFNNNLISKDDYLKSQNIEKNSRGAISNSGKDFLWDDRYYEIVKVSNKDQYDQQYNTKTVFTNLQNEDDNNYYISSDYIKIPIHNKDLKYKGKSLNNINLIIVDLQSNYNELNYIPNLYFSSLKEIMDDTISFSLENSFLLTNLPFPYNQTSQPTSDKKYENSFFKPFEFSILSLKKYKNIPYFFSKYIALYLLNYILIGNLAIIDEIISILNSDEISKYENDPFFWHLVEIIYLNILYNELKKNVNW